MASLAWPPSEVIGNRQSIRVKLVCIRGCGHERMAVACRPVIRLDYFEINSRRFYQTKLESYEYPYDTWKGGKQDTYQTFWQSKQNLQSKFIDRL